MFTRGAILNISPKRNKYLACSFLLSITATSVGIIQPADAGFQNVKDICCGKALFTSNTRFNKAFTNLIKEEGGYVNDKADPGGETKYGISKRSYPKMDIKNLTLKQASNIYQRDFYNAMQCDELPSDMIAQEVLEQGVNMGIKTAVKFLQIVAKSMGKPIDIDGKMSKQLLTVLKDIPEDVLLIAIKSLAVAHYLELAHERPPMRKFLNGWIRRVQT